MISVILYGRNDAYGYNLHKRAAISFNCIAEVLSHPEDEIIFVDCNTPDDMPTFPEAIQDTLIPKVKKLLRVLRLRPNLYDKYKKGSPLKVLEPLARNVAIRRSNPSNRWILSTNTDMVFIVRNSQKSLSDVVGELPDGFYELPRFEVPEPLWETLNRADPAAVISAFKEWGQRLHLNEVIISRPDIKFDGPGDFQLMLREQIFSIHGFNEDMILGWHVDSNLAKRLYILNGKTDSLLDHVFAYHCDHTRQATFLHSKQRTENDEDLFVFRVTSPYIYSQAETWGIPSEEIEEISLSVNYLEQFTNALEESLPGLSEPLTTDFCISESYNHGQIYDTRHMFPFLAGHLCTLSPLAKFGYFGQNIELLSLMSNFLKKFGHRGHILIAQELLPKTSSETGFLSNVMVLPDNESVIEQADIFIFDTGMMHFPQYTDSHGISFPQPSERAEKFQKILTNAFLRCVEMERRQLLRKEKPRKFLLVGSQHTWFEGLTLVYINITLTPYSSHVRHGYLGSLKSPFSLSNISLKLKSTFSLSNIIKKFIMDVGITNKERIKRIPLLYQLGKFIHRKIVS